MSAEHYRGSYFAFKQLMRAAARDIDQGGEIKPAIQRYERPDGRERLTWRERLLATSARLRRSA